MYDIKALEDEWKQYNKNKKKPWYLLFILLIGVLILSWFFLKNMSFDFKKNMNSISKLENKNIQDTSFVLLDKSLSTLLVMYNEEKIEENIEENKMIVKTNDIIDDIDIPTLPIVNNIPVLDEVPVGKIIVSDKPKPKVKIKPKLKIQVNDKSRPKKHINIIESSSVSAYKDVENRFIQSHDTDDSLFLAKSYYRKGNYKKAEYWALQTNKINNSIDESWLIYVKAKAKLKHKNEAIRILTNYAKRSNSSAAWNLLLKLKN